MAAQLAELRHKDFNPRTPCGVRRCTRFARHPMCPFQSTHPLRGATSNRKKGIGHSVEFQSTYPLRGATESKLKKYEEAAFQSTHPLRGATVCADRGLWPIQDFNPRTPCGVRPLADAINWATTSFQSTHPLRGATKVVNHRIADLETFQSTHPLRGATPARGSDRGRQRISIHAPLAGCDVAEFAVRLARDPFQSTHPLRGATRNPIRMPFNAITFQSTHPLRGATPIPAPKVSFHVFQSTHPLRGATIQLWAIPIFLKYFNPRTPCGVRLGDADAPPKAIYFNPRTPCGVRLCARCRGCLIILFQSTHPLRGATSKRTSTTSSNQHFNPRTPCGVRQSILIRYASCGSEFQSTHPLRGAT